MTLPAALRRAERLRLPMALPSPLDVAAFAAALGVAVALSWPLLTARDLATGAGDWPAHAFRIHEIVEHGILPWSHTWAGGMPLWEGYQAAPHLVTAGLVRVTGADVGRAMVLSIGVLLALMRAGVYVVCRRMGAASGASLLGALAMMALDSARQPAANFSELWGLALAPFLLYAGYRWSGRPGGLAPAALAGLAVEVHPLLAVTGAIAFAAGFLASPARRSAWLLALQGMIAAAGAAVFWLPVVISSRPAYTEPYFSSPEFARLIRSLATGGFIAHWPAILVLAALAGLVALRPRVVAGAVRFLLLCAGGVCLLALLSPASWMPDAFRTAQLGRLVSLLPILTGMLLALIAEEVGRKVEGGRLVWVLALALGVVALARTGVAGLEPVRAAETVDPLGAAWDAATEAPAGRVYADPVATARASSWAGNRVPLAGSYSGREWSIVHGPIEYLLAGNGDARARAAYLIAHGVNAALLPAGARPAIADPVSGEPLAWEVIGAADGFELLRAPWSAPLALLVSAADRDRVTVADSRFADVETAYARDSAAMQLAALSTAPEPSPVAVRYPSPASIEVTLSRFDGSGYLLVNENWDRTWRATSEGRALPVRRVGLNQIGVELAGLSGEATVTLRRGWPRAAVVGLIISVLALPVALALGIGRRPPIASAPNRGDRIAGRFRRNLAHILAGEPLGGVIDKRKGY